MLRVLDHPHRNHKAKAALKIAEPKTRKELRSFVGVANCYRDMWVRRSHALAPLAALTSKTTKWKWEPQHQKAFAMAKRIIAKETPLACPNFQQDILSPVKKQPSVKRKTERCKTSSGRNLNCTSRSRALSQIARTSSLQRTTRFAFLSRCNMSVPNGVT